MSGKLYIKTHGCQMNEYDSARMADVLKASHRSMSRAMRIDIRYAASRRSPWMPVSFRYGWLLRGTV